MADLGCGPGGYLGDLGPRAVGLDAAAAMLARARRDHNARSSFGKLVAHLRAARVAAGLAAP